MNMKTLKNHQANVLDVKARAKEFGCQIKLSTLAGAMTLLIAQSSTSYASDIEIYTKPNSNAGSGVVVMMLDTSGSMDLSANDYGVGASACDLPSGVTSHIYVSDTAAGGYSRRYCVNARYRERSGWFSTSWYTCDSSGCNKSIYSAPSTTGFLSASSGSDRYYYKNEDKYY